MPVIIFVLSYFAHVFQSVPTCAYDNADNKRLKHGQLPEDTTAFLRLLVVAVVVGFELNSLVCCQWTPSKIVHTNKFYNTYLPENEGFQDRFISSSVTGRVNHQPPISKTTKNGCFQK